MTTLFMATTINNQNQDINKKTYALSDIDCLNTNQVEQRCQSYFIDGTVKDIETFVEASNQGFSNTLQVFSHGKPGELFIEGEWKNAIQLAHWLSCIKPKNTKHINIYGCEFAKGKKGQAAVSYLETALGVCVAASDNITGTDGDWILEVGFAKNSLNIAGYPANLQFNACAGVGIAITTNVGSTGSCTVAGSGSISVVGYEGTPPFEYSIDGGAFQTSEVFIDLTPGNHVATVRDAGGNTCSVTVNVAAGSGPIEGSTGCAVTVSGTTTSVQDYLINFTSDAVVTGGNGSTVAAITGNVTLPDGTDAGFDYTIDAVITGGPGNGTNIDFPFSSTTFNSFHEPGSPSVNLANNIIQFQIIGQRSDAAQVYRDLSTQMKVDVNLDNGGCFEDINYIIGDIDATFINNCDSEPNDYNCSTSYIDRVRIVTGAGTNTYASAGSNVNIIGDIGISIYPDNDGDGYPDANFDTRVGSIDPAGYYVVNNNAIPLSSLTYVYDDPGYGLDSDLDRLHDFDALNQFHTIGGPITFSQTQHVFCETSQAVLNACAGLTNIRWFNNADAQVGTGTPLTVTSSTPGLQDANESYYYIGTTTDGCEIKSCPTILAITPSNVVAPEITITDNDCTANIQGAFTVTTACAVGSTIEWSTDNGTTWSTTTPTYDAANPMTVIARCVSDTDNTCLSPENAAVTSSPNDCCPTPNCFGISIQQN